MSLENKITELTDQIKMLTSVVGDLLIEIENKAPTTTKPKPKPKPKPEPKPEPKPKHTKNELEEAKQGVLELAKSLMSKNKLTKDKIKDIINDHGAVSLSAVNSLEVFQSILNRLKSYE